MDETAARTDAALLAAIAGGDQAALGELYDRYAALALGLANQIVRDRGVAEEVVQDAFVAAWRRANTFQPERGEARSWLLSIVHHRAIDRLRGAGARVRLEELDLALATEPVEAIELAFFGGLTHAEVAERTGQPLGTIKGRMRLGLRRLRNELRKHETGTDG